MSQENVEVVKRAHQAFNRGGPPAALAYLDPHVEWHDVPDQPESTVHHGHRGFLEAWGRFLESFTDFTVEPEKLKDLGGDRVFVVADTRGRGADSGVEFTQHVASLWTLRNGKVLQVRFLRTPSEALAAAGLPR